ncbi:MAG: ABC transporter ATP-binding protein [Geminicoccaceae bacterium]|nr:ABC transporter ATP-binding protein [Geminicoccaceae bacterium]
MSTALATEALARRFGGLVAVDEVTLRLRAGERAALIGPNGAGKTTLVNLLTGTIAPSSGRIFLEGRDVTALPAHRRARAGLVRTFQIRQLFDPLTPLEAVMLALLAARGRSLAPFRRLRREEALLEEARAVLRSVGLEGLRGEPTRTLPYGAQRLLELALALAGRPKVLLLDEPAAGVPREESREILQTIARLPRSVTVLLIEHDMDLVFRFAERILVMVQGRILADGSPREVAGDPRVRAAYLGGSIDVGG